MKLTVASMFSENWGGLEEGPLDRNLRGPEGVPGLESRGYSLMSELRDSLDSFAPDSVTLMFLGKKGPEACMNAL